MIEKRKLILVDGKIRTPPSLELYKNKSYKWKGKKFWNSTCYLPASQRPPLTKTEIVIDHESTSWKLFDCYPIRFSIDDSKYAQETSLNGYKVSADFFSTVPYQSIPLDEFYFETTASFLINKTWTHLYSITLNQDYFYVGGDIPKKLPEFCRCAIYYTIRTD